MTRNNRIRLRLESFEARLAPAVLIAGNGLSATFFDVDGDKITVAVTAGTLAAGNFTTLPTGSGDQLQTINLSGGGFDGVNLTVSVVPVSGGNGLANVGYINSTGHDLGNVTVKGDLGQIDAGSFSGTLPAVNALTVNSLGRLGTDTQVGGDLQSDIHGKLGKLTVTTDVAGAFVNVTGVIGPVIIHGSLLGGTTVNSGKIFSSDDMGAVTIDHNVQGNTGDDSGYITSGGKMGAVIVHGSILGGSAFFNSGAISSGDNMGGVTVGHNVQGNSGYHSGVVTSGGKLAGVHIFGSLIGGSNGAVGAIVSNGAIYSAGNMGKVTIGHDVQGGDATGCKSGVIFSGGTLGVVGGVNIAGSLIGGADCFSGSIRSIGDMGMVTISHDVTGGSITSASLGELCRSGSIESMTGRIAGVYVGGSIVAGIDESSAFALTENATVRAADDIGSVYVGGSLTGHGDTGFGGSPVVIIGRGRHTQTTTDLAIGPVTVMGRVEFANILAGYDLFTLAAVNPDAQIGAVKVYGDWAASNLVAGVTNFGADGIAGGTGANQDNINYGDAHDVTVGTGNPAIISKIASVMIGGQVYGTPASVSSADHFGIVAQHVVSLKIGGFTIGLTANALNDNLVIGQTGDMNVHEV